MKFEIIHFVGEVSLKSHVQILICNQDIIAYVQIKHIKKMLCDKDNFTSILTAQLKYIVEIGDYVF